MGALEMNEVAFGLPGGERCSAAPKRPIDLTHLARQTLGDRDLEREVLGMFLHQIGEIGEKLSRSVGEERKRLAHQLKGSARGVGAFALADCAEKVELHPNHKGLLKPLSDRISEVKEFIASISR